MKPSSLNLGRYARLVLLLLLLAAQGVAAAHELGDSHALNSELCSTCIIGHGMDAAVNVNCETPTLPAYRPLVPVHTTTATLPSRPNYQFARAPPLFSWTTQNPN